jgi:hypothetical protein
VLSGRGLCDGLITRPEEFYRLWCVIVCDLGTSRLRRLNLVKGCKCRIEEEEEEEVEKSSSSSSSYICLLISALSNLQRNAKRFNSFKATHSTYVSVGPNHILRVDSESEH